MKLIAILFSLLLLCACATQQPAPVAAKVLPNLSGSWEVDYAMSEHPNDKLKYLYEVTRSYLQQQVSRRDQPPGIAKAAMADLQGVVDLGRLAELITRTSVLTIEQSDNQIVVSRDGNFSLVCDLREIKVTGNDLGREICGWNGNELIFHVSLPDGLSVNHRLILSDRADRLSMSTTVRSERISQPFSINRVFMPFEPVESEFDCEYTLEKKRTCRLGTSGQ